MSDLLYSQQMGLISPMAPWRRLAAVTVLFIGLGFFSAVHSGAAQLYTAPTSQHTGASYQLQMKTVSLRHPSAAWRPSPTVATAGVQALHFHSEQEAEQSQSEDQWQWAHLCWAGMALSGILVTLVVHHRSKLVKQFVDLEEVAMMAATGVHDFRVTRVFVQKIPEDVTWEVLKQHFAIAGTVVYASISVDGNGKSKGQGIVQFETQAEAEKAITIMRKHPLNGQRLFVRADLQERSKRTVELGKEWVPGLKVPKLASAKSKQGTSTGNLLKKASPTVQKQASPAEVPVRSGWTQLTDEDSLDDLEYSKRVEKELAAYESLRKQDRGIEADAVLARLRKAGVRLNANRRTWKMPVQQVTPEEIAMASTTGEVTGGIPIGTEGLKELLGKAASSLGKCRFIVANTASGGILEAVQDFGVAPLRYSPPREAGVFCTLGTKLFECHLNINKVHKVVFAQPQRPRSDGNGTYSMYVVRFLDKEGKTALSVLLHSENYEEGVYDTADCGNPEAWKALVAQYGETVVVQDA